MHRSVMCNNHTTISEYRNYSSPIDFVTNRYHSETLRLIILVALWVSDCLYLAGSFLPYLHWLKLSLMSRFGGSLGGLKSVILTDAIQSGFMIFSFLVVPFLLNEIYGDFDELLESKHCTEAETGSCGLNEQSDPYKLYPTALQATGMASQLFGFMAYAIRAMYSSRLYLRHR